MKKVVQQFSPLAACKIARIKISLLNLDMLVGFFFFNTYFLWNLASQQKGFLNEFTEEL